MLAGIVGGVLGWIAGILASPFSTEKDEFTSISKLVYGFVSGWLVNKIDALFASSDAAKGAVNELTWIFIGYIAASFLDRGGSDVHRAIVLAGGRAESGGNRVRGVGAGNRTRTICGSVFSVTY